MGACDHPTTDRPRRFHGFGSTLCYPAFRLDRERRCTARRRQSNFPLALNLLSIVTVSFLVGLFLKLILASKDSPSVVSNCIELFFGNLRPNNRSAVMNPAVPPLIRTPNSKLFPFADTLTCSSLWPELFTAWIWAEFDPHPVTNSDKTISVNIGLQ